MPAITTKQYEQILQQMINAVVARTGLNDITDASVFKHLLAAIARELDEVYYQIGLVPDLFSIDTAVGEDLDARAAEIQPALIARRLESKAVGNVTFSRSGTSGSVTIPTGTVVKTADDKEFETTASGSIGNGFSTSAQVAAIAKVAGAAGNVASGTILKFDSKPAGVDAVINTSSFTGGSDKETDDEFRARIKKFVSTLARSTPEALEFIAATVRLTNGQQVRFAHVYEDPILRGEVILYIDDGAGTAESTTLIATENLTEGLGAGDNAAGDEEFLYTNYKPIKKESGYTVTSSGTGARGVLTEGTHYTMNEANGQLYMTPALVTGERITITNYTAYTGLIAETQKVVDGVEGDRTNYPGWRAAGVRVRVKTPSILQQIVTAILTVSEGYDKETVKTDVKAAIQEYINNLGISGDVIRSELIERIMGVTGVYNVSLTAPANDVIMADDQMPRVTDSNITLT